MKIKKLDLLNMIQEQNDVIASLIRQVNCHHEDIIRLESIIEPEPQLKQLGQSVFDGKDERLSLAAIESDGRAFLFEPKAEFGSKSKGWSGFGLCRLIGTGYDASNWQNSLIERDDIAKKLAEVDLSGELTGSELCKAMIIGDRDWVLAYVSNENDATALFHRNAIVVTDFDLSEDAFYCRGENWDYAVPINNQGEPLTASEVGL